MHRIVSSSRDDEWSIDSGVGESSNSSDCCAPSSSSIGPTDFTAMRNGGTQVRIDTNNEEEVVKSMEDRSGGHPIFWRMLDRNVEILITINVCVYSSVISLAEIGPQDGHNVHWEREEDR